MMRKVSFWQRLLNLLVLAILPFSILSPRSIVPLFFILFLSMSGYWLAHQKRINFKNIFNSLRSNQSFIVLGCFLLWSLLSVFWSIDPKQTLCLWIKLLFLLSAGIGIFLMAQKLGKVSKTHLLLSLMLGFIITNILLMIEVKTGGKWLYLIKGKDYNLTYYNKVLSFEVMLIWPILAYLNRFFKSYPDQEVKYLARIFQLVLIFQTAFVMFYLESTSVKIAFVIGAFIGLCSLFKEKGVKWFLLSICTVVFISAPLFYKYVLISRTVTSITHKIIEKPSYYHRLYIWNFVSDKILLKPWTGWGLDASRHKYFSGKKIDQKDIKKQIPFVKIATPELLPLHPHNLPLQLWVELGFPGILLIIYLISLIISAIPRVFNEKINRSAAYAAFSSSLVINMGSYGIWQSWWIVGLWITMVFIRFLESQND